MSSVKQRTAELEQAEKKHLTLIQNIRRESSDARYFRHNTDLQQSSGLEENARRYG
jgi:hypothetical protein